jgi:hypothetical protein
MKPGRLSSYHEDSDRPEQPELMSVGSTGSSKQGRCFADGLSVAVYSSSPIHLNKQRNSEKGQYCTIRYTGDFFALIDGDWEGTRHR